MSKDAQGQECKTALACKAAGLVVVAEDLVLSSLSLEVKAGYSHLTWLKKNLASLTLSKKKPEMKSK
jgi:hypothetical protein